MNSSAKTVLNSWIFESHCWCFGLLARQHILLEHYNDNQVLMFISFFFFPPVWLCPPICMFSTYFKLISMEGTSTTNKKICLSFCLSVFSVFLSFCLSVCLSPVLKAVVHNLLGVTEHLLIKLRLILIYLNIIMCPTGRQAQGIYSWGYC